MAFSHNEKHYSPCEIYKNTSESGDEIIKPIESVSYPSELTIEEDTDLRNLIRQLREQDFDGYYQDKDGTKVLVKYHRQGKSEDELNPIQKHEAEVQALRYVQGMLLIANHIKDAELKKKLLEEIDNIYQQYHSKKNKEGYSASATLWLSDQFANCLATHFEITPDNGRKQLTMARDLGILMEDHPSVCTISEDKDMVTIEKSTPYKISEQYYDDSELFTDIPNQDWMKSAKKLAGFGVDTQNTWLEQFFSAENLNELKRKGVTAPPSARWFPISANNQIVEINVAKRSDDQAELIFSHTDFLRNGIAIAYDIREIPDVKNNDQTQKDIAEKILRELILSQLSVRIKKFKELYQDVIDPKNFNFYINYQTLLSPLIGERRFHHVDNNARFVKLAKEVVKNIAKDENFKNQIKTELGANLQITHTNSAVNRNAFLSTEYSQDDTIRRQKIAEFGTTKERLDINSYVPPTTPHIKTLKISDVSAQLKKSGYEPELINELIKREKACECLQKLLDKEEPYKNLNRYQRNIMQAALEHLAMGKQSFTIAGCKSARDRTAIFACAVRTMEENSAAMDNWQILEAGIVKSLKQGHHFRSMIFHSAIVKVSLVHKNFMKQLKKSTQCDITNLLVFSRKPPKYKAQKESIATWVPPPEVIDKATTMVINETDAEWLLDTIKTSNVQEKIGSGKTAWQDAIGTFLQTLHNKTGITAMQEYLKNLRDTQLNSKSFIVEKDLLKIRVYPPKETNLKASINDFFISGMDSARSALTIIEYSGTQYTDSAAAQIKIVLEKFYSKINDINNTQKNKLQKFKEAQEEYKKFNGVLADVLINANCYTDDTMAAKGILEARNFLWIQDRKDEAVCTVSGTADKPSALLLSKRIAFVPTPSTDITNYTQQSWFEELTTKHPWVKEFYAENTELLTLSATPMQRSTPNPGNAWEEATILINNDRVTQIISGIRLGITSAYRVKDKLERQRLTNLNHMLMVTDSRLASYANKHVAMWKDVLPGNEITIPILHQTLVDPGAPHFIADRSGKNPKDMLKRKRKANKKLKKYLAKKSVYYDKDKAEIVIDPKNPPVNHIKIKFEVKETNNGINIFEKITDKIRKDTIDSRELILMAKDKTLLFRNLTPLNFEQSAQFDLIINFLTNTTPENPRPMNPNETKELKTICRDLLMEDDSPYHFIDRTTRRNLALLMQAATDLTSFLSINTGIHPIEFIRDASSVLLPTFKPQDLNDAVYKSCYERIISELLGVRMGGCKDALDREQEITALTNAMYRQFNDMGKISHYHDSNAEKNDFKEKYVNSQHKHNMCEIISGTTGSLDRATQGIAYHQETDEEKKISSLLARSCRDANHAHCSYEQYTHTSKLEKQSMFHHIKSLMSSRFNRKKEETDDSDGDGERRKPS